MQTLERWQELRALSKRNRRDLTDSIKDWIEQETTATNNWAAHAYNNITRAITKACFSNYKGNMPLTKKRFRDQLDEKEMLTITRMELLAAEIIWDIANEFPECDAKEKYQLLSEKLLNIGKAIGRMQSATIEKIF